MKKTKSKELRIIFVTELFAKLSELEQDEVISLIISILSRK